jgi:thioredoxin-related protein
VIYRQSYNKKGERKMNITFKILVVSMLISLNLSAIDMNNLPKYSTSYDKKANAYENLTKAMDKAKKSNKKILLIAGGAWCKWCGAFDNFFKENEKVANDFYGSFEVLKVYYGNGMNESSKSLFKQFPVLKGTPHFYILDKDAKLLESIGTVYLEEGNGYNKGKIIEFVNTKK